MDAVGEYTSNPIVQLGLIGDDGTSQTPFKYVPSLEEITAQVIPGLGPDEAQQAVDEAFDRVVNNALATPEDYGLLDRVDVLCELCERLHDTTLIVSGLDYS